MLEKMKQLTDRLKQMGLTIDQIMNIMMNLSMDDVDRVLMLFKHFPYPASSIKQMLSDIPEDTRVILLMSGGPGEMYYDMYHRREGRVLWTHERGRQATVQFDDGDVEVFLRSEIMMINSFVRV